MTLQCTCFVERLCLVICLTVVVSLGSGVSVAEGPKATITVSSWEAKEKYKKNDSVIIRVFSDKYGCPDGKRVGFISGTTLTRKHWQAIFDVPVGNNIYMWYQEKWSGMFIEQWCQAGLRFTPKEGAYYMLRLTSNIRSLSAEEPLCVHTFHVMDGYRENPVESYLPAKLIRGFGGPKFDQSMCQARATPGRDSSALCEAAAAGDSGTVQALLAEGVGVDVQCNLADAYRELGDVYYKLGRYEESGRAYLQYLNMRPNAADRSLVTQKLKIIVTKVKATKEGAK